MAFGNRRTTVKAAEIMAPSAAGERFAFTCSTEATKRGYEAYGPATLGGPRAKEEIVAHR